MTSNTTSKFSPEVRARAVRMVLEYEKAHRQPRAGWNGSFHQDQTFIKGDTNDRVWSEAVGAQRANE